MTLQLRPKKLLSASLPCLPPLVVILGHTMLTIHGIRHIKRLLSPPAVSSSGISLRSLWTSYVVTNTPKPLVMTSNTAEERLNKHFGGWGGEGGKRWRKTAGRWRGLPTGQVAGLCGPGQVPCSFSASVVSSVKWGVEIDTRWSPECLFEPVCCNLLSVFRTEWDQIVKAELPKQLLTFSPELKPRGQFFFCKR